MCVPGEPYAVQLGGALVDQHPGGRAAVSAQPAQAAAIVRPPPEDPASIAMREKLSKRRRIRMNSLLATGGAGDITSPLTAQPLAIAGTKATLGG